MLRYLRRLADRDLALDRTMIPLGSCTMKLNATAEMVPITWPEFARIHPFAPLDQAEGYVALIRDLERWLAEITGYDAVSLQPNAGSQGEFAGLLAIRAYHRGRGEPTRRLPDPGVGARHQRRERRDGGDAGRRRGQRRRRQRRPRRPAGQARQARRRPRRAHGHLPVDPRRLRGEHPRGLRAGARGRRPGVRRRRQPERARRPGPAGKFGADVSHLNLHKTFCIPHGGGGPGVGPIGVREHLAPYLPNHRCSRRRAPRRAWARSPPRRGAPPASCRSRGPTCG